MRALFRIMRTVGLWRASRTKAPRPGTFEHSMMKWGDIRNDIH